MTDNGGVEQNVPRKTPLVEIALGIRNCNPCNIRSGNPWQGLEQDNDGHGFAVFSANVWGFRAAFYLLIRYKDRGQDTVREIISSWAPGSDNNDTEAYIANVCKRTGFAADESIDCHLWDTASRLVYAMTIQECGQFQPAFAQWELEEGARRAGITDVPLRPFMKTMSGIGTALAGVSTAAALNSGVVVATIGQAKPYVDGSSSGVLHSTFMGAAVIGFGLIVVGLLRKRERSGV